MSTTTHNVTNAAVAIRHLADGRSFTGETHPSGLHSGRTFWAGRKIYRRGAHMGDLLEFRRSGRGLRNHLFESHGTVSEVTDSSHVVERNTVLLPLRDSSRGDIEVRCQCGGTPLLGFEPCGEVHASSLVPPKPFRQAFPKPSVFSIGLLMDADRRRRFIAAFNAKFKGDRAAFMKKTKYTKGRLTQLFDEKEAFGQLAASRVAVRMGLPADAFERDAPSAGSVSPRALDLARVYDKLNESEQARFWKLLDAAMDDGVRGISAFGELDEPPPKKGAR